jgi:recombination protein RecR
VSSVYEGPVQALVDELGRLPGVGPKSAQRIAFYLLKVAPEDANRLARVIVDARERVSWCRRCFNIAAGEFCAYCRDDRRDAALLCVVEEPRDIVAVERTQES